MLQSVRELQEYDIPFIVDYWVNASVESLMAMGAVKALVPEANYWQHALQNQINAGYTEKQSYCMIWLLDGKPVGHCNVNKIEFGAEAYMHLHLWQADKRQSGMGASFVKMSIPYFFENLQLKTLYCEPYALNDAPNKTLQKLGFEFVQAYTTIPGSFSFEQLTNKWKMTLDRFKMLD